MNEKQVKRIRAEARNKGIDWREKEYMGNRRLGRGLTGEIKLDQNCGRAVYHRVKTARQSQLRGKA